jgi:hypothetical protein
VISRVFSPTKKVRAGIYKKISGRAKRKIIRAISEIGRLIREFFQRADLSSGSRVFDSGTPRVITCLSPK